ncbi:adenylate kinase-domain containing protein [Nitzschia inconspicua]|uniref:Adenylate kinase-domain containing protein n=1 Tax=Nitzschia inconspicua TaxID=303405 RepID=A0A9K3L759_9STRA|nr:adenylate kinase-domain containing protein [Nitzschia inconspicua]
MKFLAALVLAVSAMTAHGFIQTQGLSSSSLLQKQTSNRQSESISNLWGVTTGRPSQRSSVPTYQQATGNKQATTRLHAVNIIIAGAPASGKGTQCEIIKEKFGVVHLSTGDMLRAAVAAGTEVGKKAKDFMDSGKLVPDEVIIGIVKDRLMEEDCQKMGWLLDGFPRTQAQAKALEEAGVSADCFLFLDVPDEVLVERVVGRRTDPVTGKIYHMTFSPPEDEEIASRLEQRSDDTEEKVKVRLEQFHTNVDAVKDSYTEIMVAIDGNQHPSVVSATITETIEKMTASKA